eukprot:CAMPEP_0195139176 /NCGR_PEP_ID=MMETSP0448-20130528/158924_1 /TAXON_ID=66468 /ORGANISM="Heterocapsa triquestra, Strain CCMP 448" /LENGTH=36 /DNA_ID= /DNA_START= /DNA_END= /DNA_ORIENTATION=
MGLYFLKGQLKKRRLPRCLRGAVSSRVGQLLHRAWG